MPDTADNNRVKTADWRARVETKLDALIEETREERAQNRQQLRAHSQKLDEFSLAIAKLKQGERERAELRADVERLKTEQRVWTGLASLLAALGNFDIGSLFGK